MTFYQFINLNKDDQALIVWEHGVYISSREDLEYKYLHYRINTFYVQVWYHREHNIILRFKAFISVEQLKMALSNVSLN